LEIMLIFMFIMIYTGIFMIASTPGKAWNRLTDWEVK